jgi:predicted Rossmann-fold nucleotide-binding protein
MAERIGTIPGTVTHPAEVRNGLSLAAVLKGVTSAEVELRTDGLVVAVCGGGSLPQSDPACYQAQKLALGVASRGGVLVNGGETGGISLAVSEAEQAITLHIACPYHEVIKFGAKAMVSSYQTRKMLMTVMPVVAIFPGKVGTLDELVTALGWVKSLIHQNAEPPVVWVHEFWWEFLDLLNRRGAIQPSVWERVHRYTDADEILSTLSPVEAG